MTPETALELQVLCVWFTSRRALHPDFSENGESRKQLNMMLDDLRVARPALESISELVTQAAMLTYETIIERCLALHSEVSPVRGVFQLTSIRKDAIISSRVKALLKG
jgi:hypothetical protein